ncbi:protein kinase [Crossiella sp. SN42]|uniref:protein kinase domain-containing protein n=1 Tax=Crossiella sp. SN42 TaxID=2944808 RepID=UPI00207D2604|nr:protein kinase [Crossiella sp. SN42]MCO1574259.1 protein kinase [Crossiella sp. SN42]
MTRAGWKPRRGRLPRSRIRTSSRCTTWWSGRQVLAGDGVRALPQPRRDRRRERAAAARAGGRTGHQIAGALSEVHARGIAHGDVTPHNILVTTDGVAKLADFGISRALWSDAAQTAAGRPAASPPTSRPRSPGAGSHSAPRTCSPWAPTCSTRPRGVRRWARRTTR